MSLFIFKVIMFLGLDILGGIEVTNTLFNWHSCPPLNCCYGVDLLSGTSTSWVSGLEKGKQTFSGKGLVVRGLCIIQQLVANAFSSHVCPGANALFILRRGIDSVSNQPRWWRLDRCCQISYGGICCGKLCNSHCS
ncbi:hypothetical protein CRYUN_Cryun05aG0216500 [Craigia yunnanensis]